MSLLNNTLENIRQYLATIAQPVRLDILLMLQHGELCVCDIYKKLGIAQNLASHHLKVLVDLKILTSRKHGLKVMYTRNEAVISSYQSILSNTISKQSVCECQTISTHQSVLKNECCKVTTNSRSKNSVSNH